MYSADNEGKSVIAERFIKTLKAKIYKIMTVNDSKSCLGYLNKLVDQYNHTYHHSFNEKPINPDYSVLTEKNNSNPKASNFNVNDRFRITKIFLVTITLKIGQKKHLLLFLFQKLILGLKN